MTRYFTSDLHLRHARIIDYCGRPYLDANDMDQNLIGRWNAMVQPDDEVYVLGDLFLGRKVDLPLLGVLRGRKTLLKGNHDQRPNQAYEDQGFTVVTGQMTFEIAGQTVTACHYPFTGDSCGTEDRYPELRPRDEGQWLIHGHVHDKWQVKSRMINVGVDVWDFRPVTEAQIAQIITE